MPYIISFGVIIVLLVLWIFSVRRSFVILDEYILNSISQIGVQLTSRWDALTSLLELTKDYSTREYNTISEITKARRDLTKDSSLDDIRKQENSIAEALRKIKVVAEIYPKLKENKIYIKKIDAIHHYENMDRTSRLIYNDSATKLNQAISMFPACLVAGILGFSKRDYLEEVDKKTSSPIIFEI